MEEFEEDIEPWWKGPIRYILGVVLILLLVLWFFPMQAIKLDPEPRNIPSINEVIPSKIEYEHVDVKGNYLKLLEPNDPVIKGVADKIVASSCSGSRVCYTKAIYYFVRDNFQYVSDPLTYEYVKGAKESLVSGVGDCDDASVLAANLLQAVGIRTRFVFVPGHVYVEARLPEALKRYKVDDWVGLDLTCKNCEFGEVVSKGERRVVG